MNSDNSLAFSVFTSPLSFVVSCIYRMLQEATCFTSDPSVLRRLMFAANSVSSDTPRYWELVTKFGFRSSTTTGCMKKVKIYIENAIYLDKESLNDDNILMKELIEQEGFQGHLLGVVLISDNNVCKLCGGKLLVRKDRPSFPLVYTNNFGGVNGTHFRKYCQNNTKGCSFTQHYGYYTTGSNSILVYDKNCLELPYFLSTNMTAFATGMLTTLSAEILLGQMSYRQKADIYNYIHGYDAATKKNFCAFDEEKSYKSYDYK